MKVRMTWIMYDNACYALAESFIDDDPNIKNFGEHKKAEMAHELAQQIQDTIEDYLRLAVSPPNQEDEA